MQRWAIGPWGFRVWGLAIALIGATNLVLGDFDPIEAPPAGMPGRWLLFWLANIFLLLAGAAVQVPRLTRLAALAIALYFGLGVAVLINGPGIVANLATYGAYFGMVTPLAMVAAATILIAQGKREAQWTRGAQILFGLCALFYGGAHFVYPGFTAPLVPTWLPPSQSFWADATGVAHILAGVAILTRVQARLATILLTIMYAGFGLLVHVRMIIGDPHHAYYWTENAMNLALVGVAWVMADSFDPRGRRAAGA